MPLHYWNDRTGADGALVSTDSLIVSTRPPTQKDLPFPRQVFTFLELLQERFVFDSNGFHACLPFPWAG
ncbi:MAG TPA: hypothetical protein DCY13_01780 [Verrucomicrobiales bacterium]|nr:hypothetical protein [Verrucomicrobiales bacterium]